MANFKIDTYTPEKLLEIYTQNSLEVPALVFIGIGIRSGRFLASHVLYNITPTAHALTFIMYFFGKAVNI